MKLKHERSTVHSFEVKTNSLIHSKSCILQCSILQCIWNIWNKRVNTNLTVNHTRNPFLWPSGWFHFPYGCPVRTARTGVRLQPATRHSHFPNVKEEASSCPFIFTFPFFKKSDLHLIMIGNWTHSPTLQKQSKKLPTKRKQKNSTLGTSWH